MTIRVLMTIGLLILPLSARGDFVEMVVNHQPQKSPKVECKSVSETSVEAWQTSRLQKDCVGSARQVNCRSKGAGMVSYKLLDSVEDCEKRLTGKVRRGQ